MTPSTAEEQYKEYKIIPKLTLSTKQAKIVKHAKELENTTLNKKKSQSRKTDPELTKMLELIGKKKH